MKYDQSYREEVTLRGGRVVTFRLVQLEDKDLLAGGFEQLSDESRYLRFFCAKKRLTSAELRYLTEVNGQDHFALGAVETNSNGEEGGLGVARFVRFRGEPDVAEPAITVVDEAQSLGLGGLLLQRLVEAAEERGITRFRAEFLSGNTPIRSLLEKWCPDLRFEFVNADTVAVEIDLVVPDSQEELVRSLPYRMLRRAASREMVVGPAPKLALETKTWPLSISESCSESEIPAPQPEAETNVDERVRYRRVVLATDVIEPSDAILQTPSRLPAGKRTFFMVHCVDRPNIPLTFPLFMSERLDDIIEMGLEKNLRDLGQPLLSRGFRVSTRVVFDAPASGIVNASSELHADLVVVGAHNRKGAKRFFLGSVSEHVVRHCGCSVWVARPTGQPGRPRRILVPTDFSLMADRALDTAASLVADGGEVTLLHCWNLPAAARRSWAKDVDGVGDLTKSLREMFVESAEANGAVRIEPYNDRGFNISFEHMNARPRDGILERLEEGQWDLVVMGSRGRRGLARWFLGSVAAKVARRAPTSVLVVRD